MTDSKKLRMYIRESGLKLSFIAYKIGISVQALINKIEGKTEFKASEISKLCKLLNIDLLGMNVIFFANNVEYNSTLQSKSK